ncbi:hypothetical protein BC936DRAFT_146729, partial [Jimgerdemannia flammicorona]
LQHNHNKNLFQPSTPFRYLPYSKRTTNTHQLLSSPPSPLSDRAELNTIMTTPVGNRMVMPGTPSSGLESERNDESMGENKEASERNVHHIQDTAFIFRTPPPTCHVPIGPRSRPGTQSTQFPLKGGLTNVVKNKMVTALSIEEVIEIARRKARGVAQYTREMDNDGRGAEGAEVVLVEMFVTPYTLLQPTHPSLISFMVRNPACTSSTSTSLRCDYWQMGHRLDRSILYPQDGEEAVLRLVGIARLEGAEAVVQCFGIRRAKLYEYSILHAILLAQLSTLSGGSTGSIDLDFDEASFDNVLAMLDR